MRTLVCLVVLLPVAAAFSSLPPGGAPHDKMTEEAAEAVGWPGGLPALQEAVRAPDVEEFRPEPQLDDPKRIDASDAFVPSHHCDRVSPTDNQTAFLETARYVRTQRDTAAEAAAGGNESSMETAIEALGRALHAAQDCFSHSNYVDLASDKQAAFVQALLHVGPPPEGTVLTAFDPDSDNPTDPDEAYPHDDYAKDAPDFNNESKTDVGGQTKYERAHQGAVQASAAIMAEFLGPLDEGQRQAVAALRASDGVAESTPVPVWPALLALFAIAASAWVMRE